MENLDKRLRHDIREHLQCIKIDCGSLQQMSSPEVMAHLDSIESSVDIINQLLNLTKPRNENKSERMEKAAGRGS